MVLSAFLRYFPWQAQSLRIFLGNYIQFCLHIWAIIQIRSLRMKKTGKDLLRATLLSILLISPLSVHAFIASVKGAGMGMTGVAFPQDALAGAYNPAGITEVCDRADIDLFWVHTQASAHISGNTNPLVQANGKFNAVKGAEDRFSPDFGITYQVDPCYSIPGFPTAISIVAYNNFAENTHYENGMLVGTTKLTSEYINEIISPMLAIKLSECQSIGISLDFIIQIVGLKGLEGIENFSLYPKDLSNHGKKYSWGVGMSVGWYGKVLECLDLGFVWKPKTRMTRLHEYQGFIAQKGRLDFPQEFRGGATLELLPCLFLTGDVRWREYEKLPSLANSSQFIPLKTVNNQVVEQKVFGSTNGPGFGWRNEVKVLLGAVYYVTPSVTVRGGWRYARSPYEPNETFGNMITLNVVQQFATVGATWTFCSGNEISLFYAHGFHKTIKGDIMATPGVPYLLGGGTVTLAETQNVAGIGYGYQY